MHSKSELLLIRIFLINDPNVLWAVKTIGKYNVVAYVCVNSNEELHRTLIGLRGLFPNQVKDYETLIAYESHKYTYFPDYVHI